MPGIRAMSDYTLVRIPLYEKVIDHAFRCVFTRIMPQRSFLFYLFIFAFGTKRCRTMWP